MTKTPIIRTLPGQLHYLLGVLVVASVLLLSSTPTANAFVTSVPAATAAATQQSSRSRSSLSSEASDDDSASSSPNNYPWDGPLRDPIMQQFKDEETLLKIHCTVVKKKQGTSDDGSDTTTTTTLAAVQKYVQSFAFAAVLPVQPLQYTPTTDAGVEVKFMRKKTKEKGSVDGGMRFWVFASTNTHASSDDGDDNNNSDSDTIEIVVKRNSVGQTCGKMFAEKLVVQAFVASFVGEDYASGKFSNKDPPTKDLLTVTSIFHKWM